MFHGYRSIAAFSQRLMTLVQVALLYHNQWPHVNFYIRLPSCLGLLAIWKHRNLYGSRDRSTRLLRLRLLASSPVLSLHESNVGMGYLPNYGLSDPNGPWRSIGFGGNVGRWSESLRLS